MANNILDLVSRKQVETPEIVIKGNIMTWENTMLQLSNVSSISTAKDNPVFPTMSVVIMLLGVFLASSFKYVAILQTIGVILLICGISLVLTYIVAIVDKKIYLSVIMNSGVCYNLVVKDEKFLKSMLETLEQIIIDGGVGNRIYTINIQNSTLDGNVSIMNNSDFK